MDCLESSVTLFFATAAIAALKKFDVGPAMPAFFRLALTTVAVKSLLPNFPHSPRARAFQHKTPTHVSLRYFLLLNNLNFLYRTLNLIKILFIAPAFNI